MQWSESTAHKDRWDKLDVIGNLLSGVLIAGIGLGVSVLVEHSQKETALAVADAQQRTAKALADSQQATARAIEEAQQRTSKTVAVMQADTTKTISAAQIQQQQAASQASLALEREKHAADFVAALGAAPDENAKAALIRSAGLELDAAQTVAFGLQLARPDQPRAVRLAAIKLMRDGDKGTGAALRQAAAASHMPDREIARALLTGRQHLMVRLNHIPDDGVTVSVRQSWKDKPPVDIFKNLHGPDTGWTDWTDVLRYASAGEGDTFQVKVAFSRHFSCGALIEISLDAEQQLLGSFPDDVKPGDLCMGLDFFLTRYRGDLFGISQVMDDVMRFQVPDFRVPE